MATVGGSQVAAHFLTRGKNKFSKNKGECFSINRANKWIRVLQSFPELPRRRSAARLSPRLCPTAKLCLCHARITRQHQSLSLRPLSLRHNISRRETTPLNQRPSERHSQRVNRKTPIFVTFRGK